VPTQLLVEEVLLNILAWAGNVAEAKATAAMIPVTFLMLVFIRLVLLCLFIWFRDVLRLYQIVWNMEWTILCFFTLF
jgi:hypothetical protein